ncbi:MAG: esterase family protein [Parabacteroides sp.]
MKVRYNKQYSQALDRYMEYKIYGEVGRPVLAFSSQDGHYYDYENFGMIDVLMPFIESGRIRVICADSIDAETWSDTSGDPCRRIQRQEQWYHYIADELIPVVRLYEGEKLIVTGCSMGGYHAGNFFFRRPELFDTLIALSGLYQADFFFGNYHDKLVYDNSPQDFLPNMPADHPYLALYRQKRIILCVGQGAWEEDQLNSTRQMDRILREKQVPAWVDYWGYDVSHDWEWWRKQIVYFMGKALG